MAGDKIVRTTCGMCFGACGVRVHVSGGRVVRVEGDPESPVNRGVICPKGRASAEYLYHPERLTHPLKRTGPRGSGRWSRVSWDEALDAVASGFLEARAADGPQSVALIQGASKGLIHSYAERLANAFGTPNVSTTGHVCFLPRLLAAQLTCGFYPVPDYERRPACLMVWGANLAETRIGEHHRAVRQIRRGTRLIVVDPLPTVLSRKASHWLRLRPGTDLALALGMLQVIVNEDLHDRHFVAHYTLGFKRLKAHLKAFTPRWAADICGVPAEDIQAAARSYAAARPASIQWGNAIDHGQDSFQIARALMILRAVTGNLDIPGGDLRPDYPLERPGAADISLRGRLTAELRSMRLGAQSGLLPAFIRVPAATLMTAVLEEKPYPVHCLLIQGSNPLQTHAGARRTYQALQKVKSSAVIEHFMTPTAHLADIILPAATYLEFDSVVAPPYYPYVQVQQRVVEPIGECRSELEIVNGLAQRLGLRELFFEDTQKLLDSVLAPTGLSFDAFRSEVSIAGVNSYRRFEREGFETPSKKVELFSPRLMDWGHLPLPAYRPARGGVGDRGEYPFLLTSRKSVYYLHSGGRLIRSLRARHPEPLVRIHPEPAQARGIRDGDWVWIETAEGRIRQRAKLSLEIDPRVVWADYGWWFPEAGSAGIYGWDQANLNSLTAAREGASTETGSSRFRGLPCTIYRST